MEERGVIDTGGSIHVYVLKLPHHGSNRNLSLEFFQRVTGNHYVVSGDGRHGNPEPQTFDWLLEARGDADSTIHMTYSPDELAEDAHYESDELQRVLDFLHPPRQSRPPPLPRSRRPVDQRRTVSHR